MYKLVNNDFNCCFFFETMSDINRFFEKTTFKKPFYQEGFRIFVVRKEDYQCIK